MMDKIVVVVDRSGSMASIKDDAEGGLNEFLNKQKEIGEAKLTLAQFDSEYEIVYDNSDLKLFENYKLEPRSMTALFDAVGRTATTVKNSKVSGKKIFMIVTDGHENASKEWQDNTKIAKLINEMKEDDWEFVFIGADEESLKQAKSMGLDAATSFRYNNTGAGALDSYNVASNYASTIRSGVSKAAAVDSLNADIENSDTLKKDE